MQQGCPIPTVPVPNDLKTLPYTPFVYQQLPPPLPPILEPLPDVQRQYEIEQENIRLKAKEKQVLSQPKRSGLFGGLVSAVEEAAVYVEKGIVDLKNTIDDSIRSSNFEAAQKKFFFNFRLPTEMLMREYYCRCVSGQLNVMGNLYISEHYLGFCGDVRLQNVQNPPLSRLVFLVPLRNILSVQLGISGNTTGMNAPIINICDPKNSKADSLLVYTIEGSIHQFYSFWSLAATHNVLDHVWRAAFTDPTPLPFPVPLNQSLPPFVPIDRKARPGLAQTQNTLTTTQTVTASTTTIYTPPPQTNIYSPPPQNIPVYGYSSTSQIPYGQPQQSQHQPQTQPQPQSQPQPHQQPYQQSFPQQPQPQPQYYPQYQQPQQQQQPQQPYQQQFPQQPQQQYQYSQNYTGFQ